MTDQPDNSKIDPERPRAGNPFDQPDGFSGQEYTQAREQEMLAQDPPGTVDPKATRKQGEAADGETPPEAGRRAFFDPVTGAVHGSGAGAGGGNAGEDYDDDAATGSGYPFTGADKKPPSP